MKKSFLKSLGVLILFCFISPLCFAVISPAAQLQTVANKMVTQLENNKTQLHKMAVIRRIVNQILVPNVDIDRMSASVVGRYWRTATAAQKSLFEKEFTYLVTTTYASALSSYDSDRVEFRPIRENYSSLQSVRVSSIIIRKSGQRIPITYDVSRHGDQWRVYDFSIEHVSMVQSYRAQFADVLGQGGMTALLKRMQTHNRTH